MNKRGIAPLVATLLLISFAVSLGVVIMNFGRAQVELEAQCAIDVGLRLAEIGGMEDICFDQAKNEIRFTIENGININVEGLIVNIIGTEKAETFELNNAKMGKAGNYLGKIKYNKANSGEVRQIKISPKVILYDEEQICIEKALIIEKINNC
jgi:flagellin-like protein